MTLFVGTDEAGYGPNLGPLLIGATVWQVPEGTADLDLYQRLSQVVSCLPDGPQIAIADSKRLYHSGSGLSDLETGVLASLGALGASVSTWRQIWLRLVPTLEADVLDTPWHRDFDERLPIDACPDRIAVLSDRFRAGMADANVRLVAAQADALFPSEFNRLVEEHRSKGEVLSRRTLELVSRLWRQFDDPLTVVQCDKHGGRNDYVSVLQACFPEYLVEVRCESRARSVYRWGAPERRIEFQFSTKGERYLPAALASMFAKYLRELAMRAFNAFWQSHSIGLKPTAGYAVDARRFIREIAATQQKLAIESHQLWRSR